jgi:HK97 family phage prohead protease
MDRETRTFTIEGLKVQRRDGDQGSLLVGHAAVFNQLSEDLGGFREQVAPGAFSEAIEKDDVRALFNHDSNFVLGRTGSGTLRLAQDVRGLAIEIDLPDTQTINDLVASPIERGDVSQMSFAFTVRPGGQDWAKDDTGQVVRTLKNVRLFDVSPVTYPAYRQTDIAVREMRAWQATIIKPPAQFSRLLLAREQQAAA